MFNSSVPHLVIRSHRRISAALLDDQPLDLESYAPSSVTISEAMISKLERLDPGEHRLDVFVIHDDGLLVLETFDFSYEERPFTTTRIVAHRC